MAPISQGSCLIPFYFGHLIPITLPQKYVPGQWSRNFCFYEHFSYDYTRYFTSLD